MEMVLWKILLRDILSMTLSKIIRSLIPFFKYYSILFAIQALLILDIIPYNADVAFTLFFGILLLCPILLIVHFVIGYHVGKRMQQRGDYSHRLMRIVLSAFCGIMIGAILPLMLELNTFFDYGHFNFMAIVRPFVSDFEGNWPVPVLAVTTFASFFMGMEKEYKKGIEE